MDTNENLYWSASREAYLKMSANVRFSILAVFIFCNFIGTDAGSNCWNPNQRKGYCISVKECPVLFTLVSKTPLTDEDKRFLSESSCENGLGEGPFVCCTNDVSFQKSAQVRVNNDLLPALSDCGEQPSGSKIYSGKETELDEFPWMALLNYGDDNLADFKCAGSLINYRYVLTAAHCLVRKHLHSVRLGEYDTSQVIDCIDSDCADPVVNVYVDDIIIHPNYNIDSIHRHNDIALIRLKDEIAYTSFISPVCMPSVLGLNRTDVGTNLVAAGWGRTLKAKNSSTKLKVSVPVSGANECQNVYKRSRVYLLDFQLCAGGNFVEDTCDGDSGGPLMYFKGKWAIEGIVSFSRGCGLEKLPGVYTRVAEYEEWITANLQP